MKIKTQQNQKNKYEKKSGQNNQKNTIRGGKKYMVAYQGWKGNKLLTELLLH